MAADQGSGGSGGSYSDDEVREAMVAILDWWMTLMVTVGLVISYHRWAKWMVLFSWARKSWAAVKLAYLPPRRPFQD